MNRLVQALPSQAVVPEALHLPATADLRVDSRSVRHGDVFVALPGERGHGLDWADEAIVNGAAAILTDRPLPDAAVPVIVVPRLRESLFDIACAYYGVRLERLEVHAVTGTNGKTSVTWMLRDAARRLGRRAAVIGTVVWDGPGYREPATHTTPHIVDILRLVARWGTEEPLVLALEASSHALAQQRLDRLPVDVGVLTMIGRDHLDYHGTHDQYVAAKAALFRQPCGTTACHAVMPASLRGAVDAARRPLLTFGRNGSADAVVRSEVGRDGRTQVSVRFAEGEYDWELSVPGHWQADNSAAAFLALVATGTAPAEAAQALDGWAGVPGRMQIVGRDPFPVLVDYAHTPDALAAALDAARELVAGGRLRVVFGCGGDRDTGKRPEMGAVAASLADELIITSDNPRSEPPDAIAAQIMAGVPEGAAVTVELDRATAIRIAIAASGPGDVVLIAGKGHECEQEIGGLRRPFSDVEEARRWLR